METGLLHIHTLRRFPAACCRELQFESPHAGALARLYHTARSVVKLARPTVKGGNARATCHMSGANPNDRNRPRPWLLVEESPVGHEQGAEKLGQACRLLKQLQMQGGGRSCARSVLGGGGTKHSRGIAVVREHVRPTDNAADGLFRQPATWAPSFPSGPSARRP